jgi:site-specific DNA recombinase
MAGEKLLRCAIYTRKSTERGLDQEFNSLDAQRDACEAYIKSQASLGWRALPQHYDDPAYSGGNLQRPALKKLLADIEAGRIDVVVVYKIDRLTRSLADSQNWSKPLTPNRFRLLPSPSSSTPPLPWVG